jgi:hypothetical protein
VFHKIGVLAPCQLPASRDALSGYGTYGSLGAVEPVFGLVLFCLRRGGVGIRVLMGLHPSAWRVYGMIGGRRRTGNLGLIPVFVNVNIMPRRDHGRESGCQNDIAVGRVSS